MYLLLVPAGMAWCNMKSVTASVSRWRSLNQKAVSYGFWGRLYGFLVELILQVIRLDLDGQTWQTPSRRRWQAVLRMASCCAEGLADAGADSVRAAKSRAPKAGGPAFRVTAFSPVLREVFLGEPSLDLRLCTCYWYHQACPGVT